MEVFHRANQRIMHEIGKSTNFSNNDVVDFPDNRQEIWEDYLQGNSLKSIFQIDTDDQFVKKYKEMFPIDYQETISIANELTKNRFRIFNRNFKLADDNPWHRDPVTNNTWPTKFWTQIDIRDGRTIGGVKWVWEINRHHHMVTLAKSSLLSGDNRYAAHAVNQLIDWIQMNPVNIGVNWTSPLELSIRIINWIWLLSLIRNSDVLDPDSFFVIIKSIAQQANHISRNLSLYSSANNHLIGEAAGLAITGMSFPWLPSAQKWRDTGLKILLEQIEEQISEDGVHKEQAIHYLGFVLEFYILTILIAKANQEIISDEWNDRLSSAYNFLSQIMDADGNVPSIGDSDDGYVLILSQRNDFNPYQSHLATAAAIFNNQDYRYISQHWDEKSHWLLGNIGYQSYLKLTNESDQKKSTVFPYGGYCVMRSSQCYFVFDFGPLGYLSTAAHGHADALSFTLSLEGSPIFIDPGTYAYQEGYDWRTYFRSTAAHNTIEIDGRDQSEMLGTFLWGRKARTKMLHWSTNLDYDIAIAEHDGYKHNGVIHRRTIIFSKKDFIIIVDDLLGKGEHNCSQFWHFPAECELDMMNEMIKAKVSNKSIFLIPIEIDENAKRMLYKGNYSPIQGWVSPRYGEIQEAYVINYRAKTLLPQRWIFRIQIDNDENRIDMDELRINSLNFVKKIETEVIL